MNASTRIAVSCLALCAALARPAAAATITVETFDTGLAGFFPNTTDSRVVFAPAGGNPGGHLVADQRFTPALFPIGAQTRRPEFTGDYAADGIGRASVDLDFRQRTFNGGETSAVFLADRVTADLGGGNDLLILQDLSTETTTTLVPFVSGVYPGRRPLVPRTTPGDVTVNAGAGNDAVYLLNAAVDGRVTIDLGHGQDFTAIGFSSAGLSVQVRGGWGDDHFADLGGNDYGPGGLRLTSITATHRETTDGETISLINPTAENPLGVMEWTAAGVATHLGAYTEAGSHRFTAPDEQGVGLVLDGVFTSTAADGSTISGVYFGTYTILADGLARFDVTAVYQTGTGRFAGVTGRGDVVALLDPSTGLFHFDTTGSWTFA